MRKLRRTLICTPRKQRGTCYSSEISGGSRHIVPCDKRLHCCVRNSLMSHAHCVPAWYLTAWRVGSWLIHRARSVMAHKFEKYVSGVQHLNVRSASHSAHFKRTHIAPRQLFTPGSVTLLNWVRRRIPYGPLHRPQLAIRTIRTSDRSRDFASSHLGDDITSTSPGTDFSALSRAPIAQSTIVPSTLRGRQQA